MNSRHDAKDRRFLTGPGDLGSLIDSFDWARTPLGPIDQWPQSLKTSVSLILNSQHPMWIGWGPAMTFLYNDAYIQVLSLAKHPWALGRPASEVWAEIWDICGPLAEKVFRKGEATFVDDVRLFMSRGDYLEETYYSFSYSPIRDESGNVGGLFCPSTETTAKNLNARRLETISELAAKALIEKRMEAACETAAHTLAKNLDDIPFSLLYLIDSEGSHARLEQSTGLNPEPSLIRPSSVDLGSESSPGPLWPIAEVVRTAESRAVSVRHIDNLPLGLAGQRIASALVLPVTSRGQDRPLGVLVAGVNPTRKLDTEYRTFFSLVAGQVATAIANAQAYEQERRRAEALAELDRAKTTFFSNVSHEFRTPLTLMLGPVEDLLSAGSDAIAPRSREQLALVHRNSLRLLKLVNNLLDFSRIEAGRMQASYEPTDLATVTTDLASVFRSAVERAGLRLSVHCPPLDQPVYVDHDMWEKIVLNLLSNAFKYTFEGHIAVTLRPRAGMAELTVQDTGIGIPDDELPKVFTRFHRVKGAHGRTHEGSGIGLALVQELVKLHGGTVHVESQVNAGTTFTVQIPFGHGHLPMDRLGMSRTRGASAVGATAYVEEALRWLPSEELSISRSGDLVISSDEKLHLIEESPDHQITKSPNERPRLVLAEDNADLRDYLQRILTGRYAVEAVPDGEAALAAVRRLRPDLVLTDVMMPRLDGFGLLQHLRADPEHRDIPVVMLSARAGEEAKIEGIEAGADDYLVKPFSARELLARVGGHVELARVRREAAHRERLLRAEAEDAHTRIEAILESITDGFIALDRQWRFVYVNAAAERIMGLSRQELLGADHWELFPASRATIVNREFRRAVAEQSPVVFENYYEPWQRWFAINGYPAKDGGLSVYFRDITEEKRSQDARQAAEQEIRRLLEEADLRNQELRDKQEQLIQSAKLASLGELTTGVAHELNNPLNNIGLFVGNLIERLELRPLPGMERLGRDLDRVMHEVHKATAIVSHLRTFGRGAATIKEPISIHTVLKSAVLLVGEQFRQMGIEVELQLCSGEPCVLGNAIQLEQVVLNLLNNARDAVREAATKQIRIGTALNKPNIEISVHDTGSGIEPRLLSRVFDPFFTTKPVGQGTGLGLSITYGIVQDHQGTIHVESRPGRGATFRITLPTLS